LALGSDTRAPTATIAPAAPVGTLAPGGATSNETKSPQVSIQRKDISSFVLQFNVPVGNDTSTDDELAALVALTDIFLSDYFVLLFGDPQSGVSLDFFTVESNGTSIVGDKSISLGFKGVALFNPGLIPTVSQLDILLEQAFVGESYNEYMKQLNMLPNSNVFSSATLVIFNPSGSQSELEDAVEGEPSGPPQESEGSTENSSKMSVFAIVSIVAAVVFSVALAFVLYRRRACSSEEKEIDSVTSGDKHSLVEGMLAPPIPEDDNDYSVPLSGSIRRAKHVLKGLRVIKNDDDASSRASQ
jgi:hypothetical protein